MTIQTSYANGQSAALEGQIADSGPRDVTSKVAHESITAGRFTARQADGRIKLPAASTDITGGAAEGFATIDTAREGAYGTGGSAPWAAGDVVPVLREGRLYVVPETAYTEGEQVHVRYAGTGDKGAVRNAAVASETAALPSAVFRNSGLASTLAIVEINLP